MSKQIKHTIESDGSQAWTHPNSNASISRRANGSFWCEDSSGHVYGFRGLGDNTRAPSDLRQLARRAARDLAQSAR